MNTKTKLGTTVRITTRLALAIPLLVGSPMNASAQTLVPVFVTSAGAQSGFTDPNKQNVDTVKDLRDDLRGKKGIRVVDARDEAGIVLTVLSRDKAGLTAGMFGGAARDVNLHVKFAFKEFETEMTASAQGGTLGSGGAWGRAAGKIAKQVEEWVKANRQKL